MPLMQFLPQIFMAFPKYTKSAPPQAHCFQQGVHHIWSGQHHLLLGWPIPTPSQKHSTLLATHEGSKAGTRRGDDIL